MTKPSGWTVVRVLMLALVAACSTEKKPAGNGAASSASATPTPPPGEPGTLSKPLSQYTGDEMYALVHGLNFTGGVEAQRICRGRPQCGGAAPSMHTVMRIDAVAGEDSLTTTALPANGVVAARALNRGQAADSLYDTQPGAQYEYYLIVLPAAGASATWQLEELTTTPGQRALRIVSSGSFKGCNHPFVPGARADFETCTQAAAMHKAAFPLLPQSSGDPPIWISCALGCCIADGSSLT